MKYFQLSLMYFNYLKLKAALSSFFKVTSSLRNWYFLSNEKLLISGLIDNYTIVENKRGSFTAEIAQGLFRKTHQRFFFPKRGKNVLQAHTYTSSGTYRKGQEPEIHSSHCNLQLIRTNLTDFFSLGPNLCFKQLVRNGCFSGILHKVENIVHFTRITDISRKGRFMSVCLGSSFTCQQMTSDMG